MKYAVLVIVSAFGGFVAAWLLFQSATSPVADVGVANPQPSSPVIGTTMPNRSPGRTGTTRTLHFNDIENAANVFDQQYIAWQLAAQSDVPALKSMIEKCLGMDDPLYTDSVAAIFIERYTELDPPGAMQFVTHEYRLDQATFQGNVLTSWVRYDPQAAVDYFKQITNQEIKAKVGFRLLDDPTLAQAGLVDEVKDALGPLSDRIMQQLKLRRMDPENLFQQALTMAGQQRRAEMMNAVGRWAARDPGAALARIANLSDPNERRLMTQIAIHQYALQNPKAALDWLQTNQPSNTDMQRQVLNVLASQDVEEALPLVEDFVRRTGQTGALAGIVGIWARQDPQKAISYVDALSETNKSSLYRTLAYNYMRSYPVAGLNWVVSLGSEYADIKRSVLQQVNGENENAAENALRNATDAATRSALIQGIAQYKASSDPKSALDWLGDYQGDKAYLPAYENVLSRYARQHPEAAAQVLDTSISGARISDTAGNILSSWYRKDPQAATDWATSLPPSDAQTGAVSRLAIVVARKDPEQALSLIQSLPAGVRRGLSNSIAFSWVSLHPDQVESIITKLNPPPEVASQLRRLASTSR